MKSDTHNRLGSAVSETSLCAVYLLSSSGEVLSWNRGAREMKGWESAEITGLNFSVFYDDDERARRVPEENLAAARMHGRCSAEGWRLRRDGSVFRALVDIEFLHPAEGEQAAFIKIVRDVSRQYEERMALSIAQRVVTRREAELSDAGRLMDEIFSHTPCALILCDAGSGNIVRTNQPAIHSAWLRATVLSGNILTRQSATHPAGLDTLFRRGLHLSPGDGLAETLTSGETVPETALRVAAERLTTGGNGEFILFSVLDITAEQQAIVRANHEALHDPLTGLLNRRGLMPALGGCVKKSMPFTLMILDVDRFKSVNDALGHAAGDALLTEISGRLQAALRADDVLARTGGDEFVILLPGLATAEAADEAARRFTGVLSEPFTIEDRKVISGCSIGICLCDGDVRQAEDMLAAADIALYEAKAAGRNGHVIFSSRLASAAAERFSLENDLRSALANGELQLFYQPVVDSRSGVIVSYEALMRWYHPVRGSVPPSVFIPLAEQTGLIHEMGAFALRRACAEVANWPDNERIAVNLSPRQFREPGLAGIVSLALQQSGLAPHRLELEITESALLENPEDSHRVIHELKEMGVHIVLDDFGTGYSSLSYLRTRLFSKIKIDQSFISDLHTDAGAAAIVGAVLTLCRELGLEVVAEGVEKEEQAEWLRTSGCALLQGFLFGRPGPHRKQNQPV
ncbi:EAL domain-containing protein [Enterobacteriaceae bacterium EKM102V]|uniref:putative bifunctional diguanylate cyclase/phosphodiesterase n=1 Tax=Pantoea TaxID=53335 RepID=UPI00142E620C|nr:MULTISPECIES: EAL domain-containing protein [Pantoea]KAF6652524.1 EAL domain-containing protein [Enterobacteriaceae bacterium EKM102V]KAF6661851.1 EAL domain-containing protein [Pantoea sp. EKM103V]